MKLYAWGTNSHGQLGLGFSSELVALPQEVRVPSELQSRLISAKIAGGGNHSIFLTSSGPLFGAGLNDSGQLALGEPSKNIFTQIESPLLQNVSGVTCGWDFTVFQTQNCCLVGSGSNRFNQLGNSCKEKNVYEPIQIIGGESVTQVSAGLRHVSAILKAGELCTWGDEKHVKNVTGLFDFTKIASGQKHCVALKDGDVYAWGSNTHGQCGVDPNVAKHVTFPTKIEWNSSSGNVTDLCCGWTHTLLLTDQGHVYSWGRNSYGQLGRETTPLFLPQRIPELEQVISVATGSEHCMALDSNGALWTWGWNEHGSCGTGDTANKFQPKNISHYLPSKVLSIGCGAGHSFAVVS